MNAQNNYAISHEEMTLALKWLGTIHHVRRSAIYKAWKSVDACNVNGMRVLIAAYRLHKRMLADTIPAGKMAKPYFPRR